ncbi:trehalose-phosphatase [Ruania halotolerans]|uniref:trehalose-phosphatase n=1 Tax=Ruania halotolerans TaxID=2897773 RepID=UPI001E4CD1F6|nr:trehalose-phosphatase [Ruania halotolerans]UFU07205.1 trehalose-phosphatase [Ruania halotolerans]
MPHPEQHHRDRPASDHDAPHRPAPDGVPSVSDDALAVALRTFAEHPQLLVALDFDGCLAPFVQDPADARPLPEASAALEELAAADSVQVALVSGRPVEELQQLSSPPPGTWLVGSHGAEQGEVDETGRLHLLPFSLTEDQAGLLADVTAAVGQIAAAYPGAWVEHKPAAAVLHTRGLEPDVADRALAEALTGPGSMDQVWAMRGNQVTEISVVNVSKGAAVTALRERLGVRAAVLYAGDDVTDETALAVLGHGDVGIKVGPAETVAQYRVPDEAALAAALTHLAVWRTSPQPR